MWRRRKRIAVEYMTLFLLGGVGYAALEIAWRGYTCPVMVVIGGIGFLMVAGLNRRLSGSLLPLSLLGGTAITALELCSGLCLNRWLGLTVWDYSDQPLNLMGQICLRFWGLWCLLAAGAAVAEGYLRYWLFDGARPAYSFRPKKICRKVLTSARRIWYSTINR